MQLMIAEEQFDKWTTLDVIEVKREGESLAIVTPLATILIHPINEFLEEATDLL